MNADTVAYLIEWLAGEAYAPYVGYTGDPARFADYRVVIIPAQDFVSHTSVGKTPEGCVTGAPQLPLADIAGTPLLFGTPHVVRQGDTIVVHADIIASTCFLVGRYEEAARPRERDAHGRFPGRSSLPWRAGFLFRPVADEYAALLRRWLREAGVPVPADRPRLRNLYLTHDIDAPFLYRSWKGVVRSLLNRRGIAATLRNKFGHPETDPWYTFPQLFRLDRQIADAVGADRCKVIYFVKAGRGYELQDKPYYRLRSRDIQRLIGAIEDEGAEIGLHATYRAGRFPLFVAHEKAHLEDVLGHPVHANRHHFLAWREPQDGDDLERAGITHDFTLGYADIAGFRLGTSRPVRYINPLTGRLSPTLTLHPLTAMDATLLEPRYMHLAPHEAFDHCRTLLLAAAAHSGEATFLLHNSTPFPSCLSRIPALLAPLIP
jgi:hypothetical protein